MITDSSSLKLILYKYADNDRYEIESCLEKPIYIEYCPRYSELDSAKIVLVASNNNAQSIQEGTVIWIESDICMAVETIKINSENTLTVIGSLCDSFLSKRYLYDELTFEDATPYEVFNEIFQHISEIPGLNFTTQINSEKTYTGTISPGNFLDIIQDLCKKLELGFKVRRNDSYSTQEFSLTMTIYSGEDKSEEVIMSKSFGALKTFEYTIDYKDEINCVKVIGENDISVEVKNGTFPDYKKVEGYLNCTSVSQDDLTDEEYQELLTEKGQEYLQEHLTHETYSGDYTKTSFELDTDFSIGDTVKVKDIEKAIDTNQKVIGYLKQIDASGTYEQLYFGEALKTLPRVISTITKKIEKVEQKSEPKVKPGVGENVGQHNERFNGYTETDGSTITGGDYNHAENYKNTLTNCNKSSAGGSENLLNDCTNTLVHGYKNKVYSNRGSVVSGNENIVTPSTGQSSNLCIGESIEAHIHCSSVTGQGHKVTGSYQNVSGEGHTVGGEENIVGGQGNKVQGRKNTVGGTNNTVTGIQCLVGGADSEVSGESCGCVGNRHKLGGAACFAAGYGADTSQITGNVRLIIGNNNVNSFYVTSGGAVYAIGGYNSLGADYAEYFEWADGNQDNDRRYGMLVAIRGDRIVPAHGDDFLGVISANPSVVGNAYEMHWHGKYLQDVFGRIITTPDGVPIVSDEYDPALKYIPRSQRPEWAAVGLTGRLVVCDDGSCMAGKFCIAKNGIATSTRKETRLQVLKRIDDSHVEVFIR